MKERAVFLFLLAMGTIKVYENFAEEDERDEDDDAQQESIPGGKNKGKRSIDEAIQRWIMKHDFKEEMVESTHDGIVRGRIECSAVGDDECSCRRLTCFGDMSCRKDLPGPTPGTFLNCRTAVLSGVTLCECKRYTPLDTEKTPPAKKHKIADPPPPDKIVDVL